MSLALEQDTVRQKDFDVIDWQDESEVPLEELHEHSLRFNDVGVRWALCRILWDSLVVSLDIIDKYEMIVDLIIFRGYQEAGRQQDGHAAGSQLRGSLARLDFLIQEVSVHKLDGDLSGLDPLSKFLSHLEKAIHQHCSLLAVNLSSFILL